MELTGEGLVDCCDSEKKMRRKKWLENGYGSCLDVRTAVSEVSSVMKNPGLGLEDAHMLV